MNSSDTHTSPWYANGMAKEIPMCNYWFAKFQSKNKRFSCAMS